MHIRSRVLLLLQGRLCIAACCWWVGLLHEHAGVRLLGWLWVHVRRGWHGRRCWLWLHWVSSIACRELLQLQLRGRSWRAGHDHCLRLLSILLLRMQGWWGSVGRGRCLSKSSVWCSGVCTGCVGRPRQWWSGVGSVSVREWLLVGGWGQPCLLHLWWGCGRGHHCGGLLVHHLWLLLRILWLMLLRVLLVLHDTTTPTATCSPPPPAPSSPAPLAPNHPMQSRRALHAPKPICLHSQAQHGAHLAGSGCRTQCIARTAPAPAALTAAATRSTTTATTACLLLACCLAALPTPACSLTAVSSLRLALGQLLPPEDRHGSVVCQCEQGCRGFAPE